MLLPLLRSGSPQTIMAAWLLSLLMAVVLYADQTDTQPDVGVRFRPSQDVFLKDAHIVVAAGKELTRASLWIRQGKIVAVGADLQAPAGTEVIDCQGKYLYPAFVDAMVECKAAEQATAAGYWNSLITPERRMAQLVQVDKTHMSELRKAGVAVVLAVPTVGLIKGESCVLSTLEAALDQTLLASQGFQHIRLYPTRSAESYPNSPMGATALVRQALSDADWYQRAVQAATVNPRLPLPATNAALAALEPAVRGQTRVIMDGTNELYALRCDRLAREFMLKLVIRGSGREYRQLEAIAATGRTLIIPLDFPNPPQLDTAGEVADATLQSLLHWKLAPENPGRLEQAGVNFVLTTNGLDKPTDLLGKLRAAVAAGLSETRALEALTQAPAELLEVESQVGSLEAGKLANILVTSGPLFDKNTKLEETWVHGHREQWQSAPTLDPRGQWELRSQTTDPLLRLEFSGKAEKPVAKFGLAAAFDKATGSSASELAEIKDLEVDALHISGWFDNPSLLGKPAGRGWLSMVPQFGQGELTTLEIDVLWPGGSRSRYRGVPYQAPAQAPASSNPASNNPESKDPESKDSDIKDADIKDPNRPSTERPPSPKAPAKQDTAASPEAAAQKTSKSASTEPAVTINYPLGAYGRVTPPEQPQRILFKNATLWTCDEAGILEGADLLVSAGIIEKVGRNLPHTAGTLVVPADGWHISPGIIDCHSHMATDGGVNESGQAITAEVRVADFIDSNDITIYRQLAGGVTASNILHGSANPIGGQNQVIKLRWGALDEELKMREAPAGIKFALGENVKHSNREGSTSRYPQSRMGVEQLMRDRFEAAREYQRMWQQPNPNANSLPPRRDLELEAIVEILEGKRWVHCHSYRQDEILMVLRLLEEYGVTIGSLQHILEGYKVADAMAAHGATGSSFSDWWAYKFEVLDAIPYNGALMHRAGVVVSFNSDDAELARHLNHEAAKAVKYGGVEPAEALKFVTLNPAKQLRIDRWVGSLTPGKHADFVVWNRSPLSTLSTCLQTWIDGRKYFDREEDLVRRQQDEQLRQQLIQMALSTDSRSQASKSAASGEEQDPSLWWVRYDEFCHHNHGEHEHEAEHAHASADSAHAE